MGEFLFGVGNRKLSHAEIAECERIADTLDEDCVVHFRYLRQPIGTECRWWFSINDRVGTAARDWLRRECAKRLREAGIYEPAEA